MLPTTCSSRYLLVDTHIYIFIACSCFGCWVPIYPFWAPKIIRYCNTRYSLKGRFAAIDWKGGKGERGVWLVTHAFGAAQPPIAILEYTVYRYYSRMQVQYNIDQYGHANMDHTYSVALLQVLPYSVLSIRVGTYSSVLE